MKSWIALAGLLLSVVAAPAAETAVITFRQGKERIPVTIELFPGMAPQTVANFEKLAKKGFYKKTAFHRAFPGYLVQIGDPLSRGKNRDDVGTGGPGYTLQAELGGKMVTGSVAMARLPDKINPTRRSNGSQFFISLRPIPAFSGKYTVFGRVTSGLEFLEAVSRKPVDTNDYPIERITIESIKIQ